MTQVLNAGAGKRGLPLERAGGSELAGRDAPAASAAQEVVQTSLWGFLPELSVLSSSAVLLIALTNAGAYAAASWAEPLFWLGLLLIFAPGVLRLCAPGPTRFERIGILVLLVLSFYLVKIVHSPHAFTFADELVHSFNVDAILQNHRLFTPNAALRASPFYPGLEIVTASLISLTGTPFFVAAAILIAAARLILVLALFLLFEQVSRSPRVAGLGAAIYMAQPNFLFWSAQFSYESLSLPLALALLLIAAKRADAPAGPLRRSYTLLYWLGAGALVITHHLTLFALVGALALWSAIEWLPRAKRPQPQRGRSLALLAAITLAAGLTWLLLVAGVTIPYLAPVLTRAVLSIVQFLAGEQEGRQLFVSATGQAAPLWDRAIGVGSLLLSLIGLPFGLLQVWRRFRNDALAAMLAVAAVCYFAVLPLKLTGAGWETGNRAAAFLFVGLAFVLALAVDALTPPLRAAHWRRRLAAAAITILFLGGVISGWAPQLRLAQPLVVGAAGTTFWPAPWAVAEWTRTELPPGQVFGADEINGRVLLAQAGQYVLTGRQPSIAELLREPQMKDWHLAALQRQNIRYLVIDKRRISWDNMAGYFFDRTQDGKLPPQALFDEQQTSKYDRLPVDRILDAGAIVLYDVEGLHDATSAR